MNEDSETANGSRVFDTLQELAVFFLLLLFFDFLVLYKATF